MTCLKSLHKVFCSILNWLWNVSIQSTRNSNVLKIHSLVKVPTPHVRKIYRPHLHCFYLHFVAAMVPSTGWHTGVCVFYVCIYSLTYTNIVLHVLHSMTPPPTTASIINMMYHLSDSLSQLLYCKSRIYCRAAILDCI